MRHAGFLKRVPAIAAAASLALARPAMAHPASLVDGFASGFLHPFTGGDHLLAAAAVGLLASRATSRQWWALPAGFIGGMTIGALAGWLHVEPGAVRHEWVVLMSVPALGALVAGLSRVPVAASAIVVTAMGVFHGHAHVAELGGGFVPALLAGIVVGTGLLHASGLAAGVALVRAGRPRAIRAAGAFVSLGFILLMA